LGAKTHSELQAWEPPPAVVQLAPGAVHVWRADLAALPEELSSLLSGDELERAGRFRHPRAGQMWAGSRGLLRTLLGRYLQRDPRALQITMGAHGKPALEDKPGEAGSAIPGSQAPRSSGLSFNVSHSGEIGLFAFTTGAQVGVDVEVAGRPRDALALAARTLGADTAAHLQRLEPAERQQEFLREWVRHEAVLKCLGTGLGGAADRRLEREPWIAELDMGPRAAAAVALNAVPRELCCWVWPAAQRLA
jgi:4'-phosphopantetheinyl transferase